MILAETKISVEVSKPISQKFAAEFPVFSLVLEVSANGTHHKATAVLNIKIGLYYFKTYQLVFLFLMFTQQVISLNSLLLLLRIKKIY